MTNFTEEQRREIKLAKEMGDAKGVVGKYANFSGFDEWL